MRAFHRRLLITLFALLQCLAPLMHAHAQGHEHGGLHLPGLLSPQGQETPWVLAPAADDAAVVLPLSLQPRVGNADVSTAQAGSVLWAAAPDDSSDPPRRGLLALPGPPPRLIPLPGAPPSA